MRIEKPLRGSGKQKYRGDNESWERRTESWNRSYEEEGKGELKGRSGKLIEEGGMGGVKRT